MEARQVQQLLEAMRIQSDAIQQMMGNAPQAATSGVSLANLASSIDARLSKFHYDGENGNTFEQWFKRYGVLIEEDGKDLPEPTKVRLLLGKLSDEEYNKYRDSISPTQPDKVPWTSTIDKLKGIFAETRSLFVRRYECFQIRQQPNQDLSSLIAQINAACENANLSLTKEQLKCIILVIALKDDHHDLRQKSLKMMEESEKNGSAITLKKIEEELREMQLVKESAMSLLAPPISTHAIRTRPQQWRDPKEKGKFGPQRKSQSAYPSSKPTPTSGGKAIQSPPTNSCASCGNMGHWRSACKFRDAICQKCQKRGHITQACRQGSTSAQTFRKRSFHTVEISARCMPIGTTQGRWWKIAAHINGCECILNVDTGAQATVLTTKTWHKLGQPTLLPTDIETRNCNEIAFATKGKLRCSVSIYGQTAKQLVAYVSEHVKYDLFGLPWIEALELIPAEIMAPGAHPAKRREPTKIHATAAPPHSITDVKSLTASLQSDFPDVFGQDLGHCTKAMAHLILKQEARPIFCKARPVPHGSLEAVNAELDRLLQIGAIKPIEFSHWAAPILAVKKKNGKTRVCIDFSTGLNNALELHRHPLPRPDDIYAALNGAAVFSNLDLRDAYLQMELDAESKRLCVLNTHRGLFQCQRLPFGVKSAPSIFQHLMDQICAGIPGVFAYLDDALIASKTLDDHISTLYKLFQRIEEFGLRIQLDKCKFLQKELLFLGHIVSADGIRPDPARSEAIRKMPAPHDKSTLRSFLGALNYYGRFIKPMRELRAPLDQLLRKDEVWKWTNEQQQVFEKAKEIMVSELLLTHYDPSLPIIVAADASKDGIGATISHIFLDKSEKIIEHSSCVLSDAQKNYSQIEKEALALVYAVQKFHRMIFGRKFTLLTDHKPLLAIFGSKKGIPIYAASRLQRWALILTNYDFEIRYINTTSFGQVDVLSRLIANYPRPEEDVLIANICTETECYINTILQSRTDQLPVTASEIADATQKDEILLKLSNFTKNGWPSKNSDQDLAPFYPKRQEILEIEGCLLYQNRVIVPNLLRERTLKALHLSHPGIVRTKALARQHVYWPGLDSEIERLVRQCDECQTTQKCPTKAPLAPWMTTSRAFQRIHIDFAGPCQDGHVYFILVDAFSKWPEVHQVKSMTAQTTVGVLRSIIHRLGIPEEIVSDNGTQFRSAEFAALCKEFGIRHTFTPPFHPQSNGQVERFVDTFKRAMKKNSKDEKEWAEKMLLSYRTTPNAAINGYSPDELFFGRKLRTKLALVHPKGQPTAPPPLNTQTFQKEQKKYRHNMAQAFDKRNGAKPTEFVPSESVLLLNYRQGKTEWLQGTIVERLRKSPTYRVHVPVLGRLVHRHANQLRRRYNFEKNLETPNAAPDQAIDRPRNSPITRNRTSISPTLRIPDSPPLAQRRTRRPPKPVVRFSPG